MNIRSTFRLSLLCWIFAYGAALGQGSLITVQTEHPSAKINKNIYGHFAEHLGHCIYGGFYVGEDSATIPNRNGVRTDIIDALKKLNIPCLRWPGGCFADTYHWEDGIGPKSQRPKQVNSWWGGVTEDNSFGTHDFLNMCELLGADPYIGGNVGSGTVQELANWVEYVNSPGGNSMAALRLTNGRKEPWHVVYWGVGNETWGCGGNMTPEYYANLYRQYATFMRSWPNARLFRVASGANSDDYHWTEVLMRDIPHNLLEGIGLHHYSVIDWNHKGSATDFSEAQYFQTMKSAWKMEELVTRHSAIMDKYDPQKKIALIVDEWGGWYDVEPGTNPAFLYQQNTMRDAMIAGMTLNIFNNHADRVRMANLAQTVNVLQAVILTQGPKILLTPTYHVMEMYRVHQNAKLLPVNLQSEDFTVGTEKLPAISVSASIDSTGLVHVSLVNIDDKKIHTVSVRFPDSSYKSVTGRILTSGAIQDHNTFDNPDKVKPVSFRDAQWSGDILEVKMPPFSVVVLELK